jgi:hypothetical protein
VEQRLLLVLEQLQHLPERPVDALLVGSSEGE